MCFRTVELISFNFHENLQIKYIVGRNCYLLQRVLLYSYFPIPVWVCSSTLTVCVLSFFRSTGSFFCVKVFLILPQNNTISRGYIEQKLRHFCLFVFLQFLYHLNYLCSFSDTVCVSFTIQIKSSDGVNFAVSVG